MTEIKQEFAITTQQAKQIATIKWLLYKAYNNNVPHELKEPFYYDERQQSMVSGKSSNLHLKPAIVYLLAKAELYCLALANIYLDPNYHNLNHCGIIQALARKGVVLSDPQLTETVLLQTSPLKLTAHLCVVEAIMMLYAKEIVTSERVFAVIRKFSSSQQQRFLNDSNSNAVIPQWSASDYDQLLLVWISETVSALNGRIKRQMLETKTNDANNDKSKSDYFKQIPIKELTELCDGVALCGLVAYYCPQSLQWQKIFANKPVTNADYNHNLHMFYNFCQRCLPYPIFHMSPQDMFPHSINYMRINVIALLVDLFNVFEIHPASCVVSENANGMVTSNPESNFAPAQFEPAYTRRNGYNNLQKCPLTTQQMSVIPNLRNYSSQNSNSTESRTTNSSPRVDRKSRNNSVSESQNNEQFIVHKGRNIPTLSSMNSDNCHKERNEPVAAGKPTSWNDPRKSQITGGGRRSRRNSFSDESQLTIENFGGSQDNISMLGRNPDKESAVHVAKSAAAAEDVIDDDAGTKQLRVQMAVQENWSSAAISSLLRENNSDNSPPPPRPSSNASAASSATSAASESSGTKQLRVQMAVQENWSSAAISSLLRENNSDNLPLPPRPSSNASAASSATSATSGSSASDKINGLRNFAQPAAASTLPSAETAEMLESCKVSSQMLNIRLKLEEKRRQIETDKHRMELSLKKQRQKLNKAAFLQAVSKIENDNVSSKSNDDDDGGGNGGGSNDVSCDDIDNDSIIAYDEVDKDVIFGKVHTTNLANQVEQKWLKNNEIDVNGDISPKSDRQTPDSDALDIEKCQKSISEMDSSLHAIQTDLQWLAVKENEMLQAPDTSAHHEVAKPYPISFMLNQEQQQTPPNHTLQKMMQVNSHQNQNGFFANTDYPDNRANYNTIPNKNFVEYNYADACATCTPHAPHHHLSLLPTVPAKSPLPPTPPTHMMNPPTYDNENYYVYQMQQQHVPVHVAPPIRGNYHSMNVVENELRNPNYNYQNYADDKDKMRMQQQFYLHKPNEPVPSPSAFQFQNASPVPSSYGTPNMTSFSQRKTWDNSSSSSPVHSPTHMFTSTRYGPKEPSYESKFKPTTKYADEQANISLRNDGMATELDYSNYFANSRDSRGDSGRHSAGSVSIPSPSADDMAPQCISFIGDATKTSASDEPDDAQLNENMNKLNISNGSRTYRIPSPTNKGQSRPNTQYAFNNDDSSKNEKGFYVSFSSNDDDNFGKTSGPITRFSDRSPIKVPPRFRKAMSNSSITSDKDRANTKSSPRSKFEQFRKSDTMTSFKDIDSFGESRTLQKQSSDDSDKALEKLATDTVVIKNRKNNPAALVINADISNDPAQVDEMERKKERILLQSLQRRQQQEEMKARKEIEQQRRKEQEKQKEDKKLQKKEEEKRRRAIILEKHRLKKAIEDAEREGKPLDKELLQAALMHTIPKSKSNAGDYNGSSTPGAPKLRPRNPASRPRPKTIHIESNLKDSSHDVPNFHLTKKGSSINLAEHNNNNYGMNRRDYYRGSQDLLLAGADIGNTAGTSASSIYSDLTDEDRVVSATYPVNGSSSTCGSIGRRRGSSYRTSRDASLDRATSRIARPKFSTYQSYPRKSSSLMNLCGSSCDQDSLSYNSRYVTDTDSGLGRATPPHRTSSPAPSNSSPSGPGSLPPSHHSRRLRYDDTASESGGSEYSGLRLYKQPATKSNRGIIMNAVEYFIFPGEVNRNAKNRVLEEINRLDAVKHFLVLFRDSRCQFRALYSYYPESEEIMKLYGTGPKQVTERMFDRFFKYNSGAKNFTPVHTKHLTVTIDAFTIHNSLWQGKKVNLPNKRDMSLVI